MTLNNKIRKITTHTPDGVERGVGVRAIGPADSVPERYVISYYDDQSEPGLDIVVGSQVVIFPPGDRPGVTEAALLAVVLDRLERRWYAGDEFEPRVTLSEAIDAVITALDRVRKVETARGYRT